MTINIPLLCMLVLIAIQSSEEKGARMKSNSATKSKSVNSIKVDGNQGIHVQAGSGGHGFDDDEDGGDDGSAEGSGTYSIASDKPCMKLQASANAKKMTGDFVPRCTSSGDYAPKQCHGSTGECWCANKHGHKIPGTIRRDPETPICSQIEPNQSYRPAIEPTTIRQQHQPSREIIKVKPTGKPAATKSWKYKTTKPMHVDNGIVNIDKFEPKNKLDTFNYETVVNYAPHDPNVNTIDHDPKSSKLFKSPIIGQPGVLAGVVGGAVVGLLCSVLLVMFLVYRMRKKLNDLQRNGKPPLPSNGPAIGYANGHHDHDLYA